MNVMSGIRKILEPAFVVRYPISSVGFYEFGNIDALKKFLQEFDFVRGCEHLGFCIPSFQLGTKMSFNLDGYSHNALRWGPRFILTDGSDFAVDNGKMSITIPNISQTRYPNFFVKQYSQVSLPLDYADAVLDLQNMSQLWPICCDNRTKLQTFLGRAARERYQITRL